MYQHTGRVVLASAEAGLQPISYATPSHWPISGLSATAKRAMDIGIALLLLTALGLLMLLIAAAIRLETPGPVLFRQRRIGFANVPFDILKFRTMRHDGRPGRPVQVTRHDPRVTRVGALLRRTSIDEFPQLINVLRGDMSIVGPRPHAPGTCAGGTPFEMVTPCYAWRHRVRPGMTGLAQVRGWRGETETEAKLVHRIEADLEYIDNWSLRLDAMILARTAVSLMTMRNAY